VQVYQSAAVVTGIQAPGGARRVRFVRLWVREGRDWKIAIHHGTTISQAQANATPVAPAGRTATPLPALSGEEAAVFSVQKALSEAYARHDATTYERWTAPEFVTVTTSGQVVPRDQWLKNNIIENQEKRVPSVNDDVKVQIFGDVAVITFRNLGQLPDGTVAPPERVTTVLARKNGAWQQVLTQSTVIREMRAAAAAQPAPERITQRRHAHEREIVRELMQLVSIANVATNEADMKRNVERLTEMFCSRGSTSKRRRGRARRSCWPI